jgi:hypothetical protein
LFECSINLKWFRFVTRWFGIDTRSSLIFGDNAEFAGMGWTELREVAKSADLLVNLSGHATLPDLVDRVHRKAYIDVDPGFTQFWHADPRTPFRVAPHDFYFTIGENIGTPTCGIPTSGIPWRPIRQPIVLDQWPVAASDRFDESRSEIRFTTVASWRGQFGPVQFDGRTFGLRFMNSQVWKLPGERRRPLKSPSTSIRRISKIAINWSNSAGRSSIRETLLVTPESFRRYVQQSGAEFSVAQGIYVETNCGWFSDRSVRYLASGRPILVQDTGFTDRYPASAGLLTYSTFDEAVVGVNSILANYPAHCRAAREIAEEFFDARLVLGMMLKEVGL